MNQEAFEAALRGESIEVQDINSVWMKGASISFFTASLAFNKELHTWQANTKYSQAGFTANF